VSEITVTPAVLSVAALVAAIALSMVSRINIGLVALALAWLVGTYGAGLGGEQIVRGFPASLFLAVAGVTLLFAAADANGTLAALARRAGRLARGDPRVIAPMCFVVACGLSAVGPGAVSSVALVAPLAMAVGARAGVPAFLMALMVANGANAGNLSPVSAVGIIANSRMAAAGLPGHQTEVFTANLVASVAVAAAAYLLLGGYRRRDAMGAAVEVEAVPPWSRQNTLTTAVIAIWILGVIAFGWNLGLSAIALAMLLVVVGAASEAEALKRVPWGVALMVCGVSTLVAVVETTGGMDLFSGLLARLATPGTVNGVIAFVTGAISLYSSTSGVVLPAFLPTVPGLIEKLGGGDMLAVSLSINVGSSLVDVSPLSTLGALCLAAAPAGTDTRRLFRQLMMWGLSMTIVGALWCQAFL
jgi:di/tricarboxylate transporter